MDIDNSQNKNSKKVIFFNIPNILTLSRIILGIIFFSLVIVYKILKSKISYDSEIFLLITLFFVFVIAIITDGLDGFFARKLNIVTNFGKHFDPLADSIFFIFVFFSFVIIGIMGWYFFLIIFLREFIMHIFLRPFVKKRGFYLGANITGKIKMFLQCALSLIIILSIIIKKILINKNIDTSIINLYDNIFAINSLIFFTIIVCLSIFSFFVYILDVKKMLKNKTL